MMQAIKQQLATQIQQKQLPHALLLIHPQAEQIGQLACYLQQLLLCASPKINQQQLQGCGQCKHCLLLQAGNHPDMQMLLSDTGQIGIDDIRAVTQFLQKTAQLAQSKVLFIEHAEQMTASAANALLKTLEEPTDNTFILLGVKHTELLLPTIVSRCQLIRLPSLPANSPEQQVIQRFPELADSEQYQAFQQLKSDFIALIWQTSKLDLGIWLKWQLQSRVLYWLVDINATLTPDQTFVFPKAFEAKQQSYDILLQGLNSIRQYPNQNNQWRIRAILIELYQAFTE